MCSHFKARALRCHDEGDEEGDSRYMTLARAMCDDNGTKKYRIFFNKVSTLRWRVSCCDRLGHWLLRSVTRS